MWYASSAQKQKQLSARVVFCQGNPLETSSYPVRCGAWQDHGGDGRRGSLQFLGVLRGRNQGACSELRVGTYGFLAVSPQPTRFSDEQVTRTTEKLKNEFNLERLALQAQIRALEHTETLLQNDLE
eukprot:2291798-Amphidinium_carterae.1